MTNIRGILEKTRKQNMLKRVSAILCVIVVFLTNHQLTFKVDTLERYADCGYPDHVHDESCFVDGELACDRHVHTDACYQTRPAEEAAEAEVDVYDDVPVEAAEDTVTGEDTDIVVEEEGEVFAEAEIAIDDVIAAEAESAAEELTFMLGGGEVYAEEEAPGEILLPADATDTEDMTVQPAADTGVEGLTVDEYLPPFDTGEPAVELGFDSAEEAVDPIYDEPADADIVSADEPDDAVTAISDEAEEDAELTQDEQPQAPAGITVWPEETEETEGTGRPEETVESVLPQEGEETKEAARLEEIEGTELSQEGKETEEAAQPEEIEETELSQEGEETEEAAQPEEIEETELSQEGEETEEAARPEEGEEAAEPEVPEQPEKGGETEEPEQPEEGEVTEEPEQPEEGEGTEEPELPEEGGETEDAARPEGTEETESPEEGKETEASELPEEGGETEESETRGEADDSGSPGEGGEAATPAAATRAAAIALNAVPMSLSAMMEKAVLAEAEVEDAEETAADETASDAAEAEPADVPGAESIDRPEAVPADEWKVTYDDAVLAVAFTGGDYLVTPVASFEETVITVSAGDTYVLTLGAWEMPAEAADGEIDEAGEETAEEAPEAAEYPARELEAEAGNLRIHVRAPEGALPVDAALTAAPVEDEAVLAAIAAAAEEVDQPAEESSELKEPSEDAEAGEADPADASEPEAAPAEEAAAAPATLVYAAALDFVDVKGESIRPLAPVSVTLSADGADFTVVRMDAAGACAVVGTDEAGAFQTTEGGVYALAGVLGPRTEETAAVEALEAEPLRPAQAFEASTDTIHVTVMAPEGAFPERTTMTVSPVETEDILSTIAEAAGDVMVKKVYAVDITFFNAGGEAIEPLAPISVVMKKLEPPEADPEPETEAVTDPIPVVVHVDDGGEASVVEQDEAFAEEAEAGTDAVAFTSDAFSIYAYVETLKTNVIAADGETYGITVTYGPEANIPVDATLDAKEITDDAREAYLAEAEEALELKGAVSLARFFDITIMSNGEAVQPAAPVQVKIELADAPEESAHALHFPSEGGPEEITTEAAGNAVSFQADSFSVYGVVYTVDFHWGVNGKRFDLSMTGGSAISLSRLVEALDIARDDADTGEDEAAAFLESVESVTFSTPGLLWVGKVGQTATVGLIKAANGLDCEYSAELTDEEIVEMDAEEIQSGDWVLISLRPFDSEECLTVTLDDGERFTIAVTDARLKKYVISAEGETYEITVTYADESGIPETAELEVTEISEGAAAYDRDFDEYVADAEAALGWQEGKAAYIRLFDIRIVDGEDPSVVCQPAEGTTVDVQIRLSDANRDSLDVVHFADGEAGADVVDAETDGNAVRFEASGFSVYAVAGYTLEETIEAGDGSTYRVRVTFAEDALLPDGARLNVTEYTGEAYDAYMGRTAETLAATDFDYARVFDIAIVTDDEPEETGGNASGDGTAGFTEVHPAAPVEVAVELLDAGDAARDFSVVHFAEDADAPEQMDAETAKNVVSFRAESFSAYAIVGTTIEKTVLASDGKNYRITVTYGPDAGIPEDAVLEAEEIHPEEVLPEEALPEEALPEETISPEGDAAVASAYTEYVSRTEKALGMDAGTAGYIRLFDISIVDKDDHGIKYQPAEGSSVTVRVELADSSSEHLNVVHFSDGSEEGEALQSSTENGEDGSAVEFQTDGFSVYSIVDAPEPIDVYQPVSTLDEIEDNKAYYLSIARNGTNYMTSTSVQNGAVYELAGITNRASGENWYFETVEAGKVNIYFLDSNGNKMYLNVNNARSISFSETPQALSIEETRNAAGTFYIYTVIGNVNYALSVRGSRNFFFEARNNGINANERVVLTKYNNDPYELDGRSFGIAYNNDSTSAAAMTAERAGNQNRLSGLDLVIRADVLNNSGNLLVAENSDIQEWVFESAGADNYYIKTTVEGVEKYLHINATNVSLVDDKAAASKIQVIPGRDEYSGKWHFTVGGHSLNYAGSAANYFNAATNSTASTWLNLVERSTLSDDDFVEYSAHKISASDNILSATERDQNGQILHDGDGNVIYKENKAQVVIYTRVWNETKKKYEFYAVDHDGSLVRVYDSGDQINWIGNKVNSALWEFTEYTNADGTPTYFYELENAAYAGTYLAPQSDGITLHQTVGINLNGRREGFDYSSIVAWNDDAYAYTGLKIEQDADGSPRLVPCPIDEAADFHFAVIAPPVSEADSTTIVATVDNEEFGISIKMIDFNNPIDRDNRDTVQRSYLGFHKWEQANAYNAETGLVSTNLTGGYPTITAQTEMNGSSLSGLFSVMTPANHLFIQSVYNESGYFEYDSTQNFAHYNTDGDNAGDFTVYNQLGAIGTNTGPTRVHGQFMPYNDISAENGYARDDHGNVITNQRNIRGEELSDTDPSKGKPLYSIPQNEADYFFGMELSAVFTQTPDGVDNWGHDIIFEFTGDDDFWFYVDGELVLDLGGVHSALGGSVNFRTGEVVCNGEQTTLYDVFKDNYRQRGLDVSALDEIFVTKTVNGQTVHVFSDYTTHEMKMFYMERGAGASNLKMRFNLASVKPGTVELSKRLKGIDNATNKLIQYPYQIWYQTVEYAQNADGTYVLDGDGNRVISGYHDAVLLSQPAMNTNLTGQVYAVYKGTRTLIPYRDSMSIGGTEYDNVFLLRAGETAVINFPENTYRYKLVECGVNTAVYEHVYINGDQAENQIFGKPHHNTDGWDPAGGAETLPESTETYPGTARSDFGITYYSTEGRPRVEYTNEVSPQVMRTVSFKKVLYNTSGVRIPDEAAAQIPSVFSFRLYLGNEFADQENLLPADMHTYYVKGPDGDYCKWDRAGQRFVSLHVDTFEEFKNLSEADRRAGTFTTSMYGSISKIPAGYTVEVRDLIVGTKYKIVEPDRELPKGYTRRDSDGYVRTDPADGPVVYYTQEGTYGRHPEAGNTITAEPISDTIADTTESPEIEVRNQEGWGLTVQKVWTDRDFMAHDPIYLAIYLQTGSEPDYTYTLLRDKVRQLTNGDTEAYFFFQDLKVDGEPYSFGQFVVREVMLRPSEGHTLVVDSDGRVTVDDDVEVIPIDDGDSITVGGTPVGGAHREETYSVDYQPGSPTGHNDNIRVDTVTNSRPGIQIFKTDWEGANYLSGATFTLKDGDGNDVAAATYTSDESGLVTSAYLSPGTYRLAEIKTPSGYVAMEGEITITVSKDANNEDVFAVAGGDYCSFSPATEDSMARITVKNRTLTGLKIVKVGVDGEAGIPLGGVHFALYDQVMDNEGNLRPAYSPREGFEDLVTNASGEIEEIGMDLGTGTYYLREKAAPSGYKKLADDLCFTIGEDGILTIHNREYASWLTTVPSDSGAVSYQIGVENSPLGITIRKTDENGSLLTGAQFELSRKNDGNVFEIVSDSGLGENGQINLTSTAEMTFTGLPSGIYKFRETHAPEGYIITTQDIYFSVSDGAVMLTDESGNEAEYSSVSLADENTTIVVKNTPGAVLPATGGPGTAMIYGLGIAMIMLAGTGLLLQKKRKASSATTGATSAR